MCPCATVGLTNDYQRKGGKEEHMVLDVTAVVA
jgi:hypothetical protein